MQVIAEGIERQEQVDLLRSLHCDHAQGWLYSRAIDADAAAAMITERPVLGLGVDLEAADAEGRQRREALAVEDDTEAA